MIPRALTTRQIFASHLWLSTLDDGRQIVSLARGLSDKCTAHERLLVNLFVRSKAVDFLGTDGDIHRGRDAEAIYEAAREWSRNAVAGKLGPETAALGPLAVDLALAIGERWRQAS